MSRKANRKINRVVTTRTAEGCTVETNENEIVLSTPKATVTPIGKADLAWLAADAFSTPRAYREVV